MDTLEKQHIKTIEEAIEVLHTSGYNYTSLKDKLNKLIGYLQGMDELKKAES